MNRPCEGTPKALPVGWVSLDHRHADELTIRWRRGESLDYVLMVDALGTILILPAGWTDLVAIRRFGQRWVQARNA
jgi:hypothetical protein